MTVRTFLGRSAVFAAFLLIFASMGLSACATKAGNVWSTVPNLAPTSPVVFQQRTGRVALAPIAVTLPERRSIGTLSRNVDCWVFVRPLTDSDFTSGDALTSAAAQALTAAHLTVVPDGSGDIAGAAGNDYLLIGTVVGVHADMCDNAFMEDGPNSVDLELDVSWKMSSVRDNRVVFETNTSGIGHSADKNQSVDAASVQAMGDAIARLLQTATAQQYLTFGHLALPQPTSPTAYPVPVGGEVPGPVIAAVPSLPEHDDVAVAPQAGTAEPELLIPAAEAMPAGKPGMGTYGGIAVGLGTADQNGAGFILSPAGYILASSAAIGDKLSVAVTLASGEQADAAVIRRNESLGLTLLKLKTSTEAALPIEPRKAEAGARVYVVTTPSPVASKLVKAASGSGEIIPAVKHPLPGSAVLDARGSVLGVIVPGAAPSQFQMISIGSVFRLMKMAATFTNE